MRRPLPLFLLPLLCCGSEWLARVEPLMSPAEKKAYVAMSPREREAFESQFWKTRRIAQQEYLGRATYADSLYGSGKPGSGANTDRGRVFLGLGQPAHINRLASSRTFLPIEIWTYTEAPLLDLRYEFQLLFFQRNGTGEYKLYSPTIDTIRALLNPQASTRGLFGVNDVITEADIRTRITLSPTESEVIDAAVGLARGIKGMGNEQLLAMVASPARALNQSSKTVVSSRFITDRPPIETFQTTAADGMPQVDLAVEFVVHESVAVEVMERNVSLGRYETAVHFEAPKLVRYEQRLALLPGEYRLMITVDGHTQPYGLTVSATPPRSILTGRLVREQRSLTPFQFQGSRVEAARSAQVAVVDFPPGATVFWRLRHGVNILWHANSTAMVQSIGDGRLPAGEYRLEAVIDGELRSTTVQLGLADDRGSMLPLVSYNANLDTASRARLIGRQWLARRDAAKAKTWFERAWNAQPDVATRVDLCRADALAGRYDDARSGLEEVLKQDPNHVDALLALAYVEAGLQDFTVAERLYRKASELRSHAANTSASR